MWVRGRIPVREGSITVSGGRITGTGLLAADRIDTALGPRDWHLRSAHYLHTDKHPTIEVVIDGADLSSGSVPCEVTVRGGHGTRPVAAPIDQGGRHTRHHRRDDGGSHRLSDAGPVGRSVTSCEPGHHARRPADRERVEHRIRWCKKSFASGFGAPVPVAAPGSCRRGGDRYGSITRQPVRPRHFARSAGRACSSRSPSSMSGLRSRCR